MVNISDFPKAELERCPRCRDYLCLHAVYESGGSHSVKECHYCDKSRLSKLDKILRPRSQ